MLERLILLAGAAALIALATIAVRAYTTAKARRLMQLEGSDLLQHLGAEPDGRPTLVTFSTPSCAACRSAQAPAVNSVEQQLGPAQLRVVRVDAARQPDVAQSFGIMTVPSTVVLDPSGRVAAVNHGFTPSRRLIQQLQTI